jgi:hypothetical protein
LQHYQKDVHCKLPGDKAQINNSGASTRTKTVLFMKNLLQSRKSIIKYPSKYTSSQDDAVSTALLDF